MIRAWVFDAYGTLFDVHSAVARHAAAIGADAPALSELWRRKQLEYSWVAALIGRHVDFERLTEQALAFALAAFRIEDAALEARLRDAYRDLDAYPEVAAALAALGAQGLKTAILSNGTPAMLARAIASAGLDGLFDPVLSVEAVGVYKPDRRVYQLAADRLGLPAAAIAFASSNAWDAAGAAAFGFQVTWINRAGQPDEYGLAERARVTRDLASALMIAENIGLKS